MILGFKKQFQPKIKTEKNPSGTKIHTIREDKNRRWKEGNSIQFATRIRTKHYSQFDEGECKFVQRIEIDPYKFQIKICNEGPGILAKSWKVLSNPIQLHQFAINDGFDSIIEFFEWFDKPFKGVIIHWTDFKYGLRSKLTP